MGQYLARDVDLFDACLPGRRLSGWLSVSENTHLVFWPGKGPKNQDCGVNGAKDLNITATGDNFLLNMKAWPSGIFIENPK